MLPAVNLDDQPQGTAGEIRNIGADRMLPTKPNAQLVMAKTPPERPFGVRHGLPQGAGFPDRRMGLARRLHYV